MRTVATAAIAATLLALTACSSSDSTDAKPDVAACKKAMAKQLDDGMANGTEGAKGTRPDACQGVDDKTVQRLVGEVMEDQLGEEVEKELGGIDAP